jgi:adenylate cyclase
MDPSEIHDDAAGSDGRPPVLSPHGEKATTGAATQRLRRLTHLVLSEAPRYDAQQAAQLAGVDVGWSTDLWRCLGFATPEPGEVMFTDSDVDALRIAAGLSDSGLSLELPLARALGQSMARMSEWQADQLRELSLTGPGHSQRNPSSTERSIEGNFAVLLPTWERLQQHVWRRHLLASIDRLGPHSGPTHDGATSSMVVGFADIAEFTSTSRGLTETRLAEYIENFEAASSLIVTDRGGRVVKTIGDEIMFVVDDPHAGADIALTLAQRPSDLDGRSELHVGLAYGPVLRHLGDYYGTVVNLASRLTSLARPGTALIDHQMATAVQDNPRLHTRALRPLGLRGFPRLQPWLLRPHHDYDQH